MTKTLQHIILLFLLFATVISSAQEHEILDRFTVQQTDGKVFISCTISSGSTCNGIDVLLSEDSLTYQLVANYSGVCGSSSAPVTYNFVDERPIKNKKLFYKLDLGGQGFTNTLSITVVDLEGEAFQIRPNPANGVVRIYFKNPNNNEQQIIVYNSSGGEILSKSTNSIIFELNVSKLPSGVYPFVIAETINGKFVVNHQ